MSSAEPFDLNTYVMHHIVDSQEWHIPFLPTIHIPAPLTLHVIMMILTGLFMVILFCNVYNKKARVPSGITSLLEIFVIFIRDQICIASMGKEDGRKFTPFFCTLFFFILILNSLGMIPLFVTATGNLSVTMAFAAITLTLMIGGGIYKNGFFGFAKSFVPSGVPFFILPILIPVEVLSMFIKPIALMIRLFANMIAGHIVILSLIGTIVLLGWFGSPLLILVLFLNILEILIIFLQAYIFTLFSAIFIGQMLHPEH